MRKPQPLRAKSGRRGGYHPRMTLSSGEEFAGFRVIRPLGSGGMGEVYLVQHPRLPRRDALKVLPADVSADPDYRARFNREADLASTLWHPHIVGVHDRGEADGQLWLSMDYVDGVDAGRLLAERYPAGMPEDDVARIITAVASALDYANKQGLLHRDVKPANIMLTHVDDDGDRRILLTDFGIARSLDDVSGLTTTNMTVGTVAYSAPEQLMGEDIDGRADQYALGATAYHLLTGSMLFPHSNPAVVISHHLNSAPPALSTTRPELSALDPVLATALSKTPEERFTRCSDFARTFSEQVGYDAPAPSAPTAPAPVPRAAKVAPIPPPAASLPPGRQGTTARKWVPWAVACAVVALLSVVALAWRPWDSRSDEPVQKSPLQSETTAAQGNSTTSAPTRTQSTIPTTAVDSAMLTAAEISRLLGIDVSGDPAGAVGAKLQLDSSTYGPSDHARQVDPSNCTVVTFTGDNAAYGDTDVEAVKTESYAPGPYTTADQGPAQLEQTVAVFPSAASAQRLLATQQRQWAACSTPANPLYPESPYLDVSVMYGYENGRIFALGDVERSGDVIAISMASNNPLWHAFACQQALGVRENVVVEARTCQVPPNTTSISDLEPADPAWAVPDAQRLVEAMLEKVS